MTIDQAVNLVRTWDRGRQKLWSTAVQPVSHVPDIRRWLRRGCSTMVASRGQLARYQRPGRSTGEFPLLASPYTATRCDRRHHGIVSHC